MKDVLDDLRYAFRGLRSNPQFSLLIILILAVGIGANTATFTVVDSTLLRPLPYDEPDRLVMVWETSLQSDRDTVTSANVLDWRAQNHSFEELAAFDTYPVTLSGRGEAERFHAGAVSEGFFAILRAKLSFGRRFESQEFVVETSDVVILSDGVWRARFGADPSILGERIMLEGRRRTIVGVLEPEFRFVVRDVSFWIPLALDNETRNDRKWHWLRVIARLNEGASVEQAQADMDAIAAGLALDYPEWMKGWGVRVVRLREDIMSGSRKALLLLMGAVVLLLLVASANVANLLVARGATRATEMTLRTALGAGKWRLVRQLLVESTLLGGIGGVCGLALGWIGMFFSLRAMPLDLPREADVRLDWRVAGFTLFIALVTSVGCGLIPARHALRRSFFGSLTGSARHGMSVDRVRAQRLLVISEVAVSLVLLMGTGLLLGSLWRILSVDPGFDPRNKLAMVLILPLDKYPAVQDQTDFFDRLMDSIRTLPGVRSVDSTTALPLNPPAGRTETVYVEGRPLPPPGEQPAGPHQRFVTSGYFRTMGIRLLRGRIFDDHEAGGSPGVLVVNEAMAEKIWPGEDPLGQRVAFERGGEYREVIGVVSNTKGERLDQPAQPAMYAPPSQRVHAPISWAFIVVSTEADPASLTRPVREKVRAADAALSIYRIRTLEEELAATVADRRFSLLVLGVFSSSALLLAAIGVYSVARYDVAQRTREIGVRMALGATNRDVSILVIGEGMRSVVIGLAIGAVFCTVLTRLISSMLFEVTATDPATLAVACLVLTTAALAACSVPAHRAARISPAESMRYE